MLSYIIRNFLYVITTFRFTGRASRSEFWWFALVQVVIGVPLEVLGYALHLTWNPPGRFWVVFGGDTIPGSFFWVCTLVQGYALNFRRLHDINISGWWWLVTSLLLTVLAALLFPSRPAELFGSALVIAFTAAALIWSLVFLCLFIQPGSKGQNRYGRDPLALPVERENGAW